MKIFEFIRKPDGHRKLYFFNKKILSYKIPCKYRKIFKRRFNGLTREEIRYLLEIQFLTKLGYPLNLDNPKTFNEKIQWLKLHESTPIKTRLADKYLVRDWVAEKIGDEYGDSVVEAHHIDYFTQSQNNDSTNIIIISPNYHRIIHRNNPHFNRNKFQFEFDNGETLKLKLFEHLKGD